MYINGDVLTLLTIPFKLHLKSLRSRNDQNRRITALTTAVHTFTRVKPYLALPGNVFC